jgi:hypothetical protein
MSQREQAITPASFASFGALLRYLRQRALLSRAELARAALMSLPCWHVNDRVDLPMANRSAIRQSQSLEQAPHNTVLGE